jgi:hypothetical protein
MEDTMYDITLNGSLIGGGRTPIDAQAEARDLSVHYAPGRLIRVHGVDGETVIAEYRDGFALAQA